MQLFARLFGQQKSALIDNVIEGWIGQVGASAVHSLRREEESRS
jgi:hypothetical protein